MDYAEALNNADAPGAAKGRREGGGRGGGSGPRAAGGEGWQGKRG